jgi:hypothetical protein
MRRKKQGVLNVGTAALAQLKGLATGLMPFEGSSNGLGKATLIF